MCELAALVPIKQRQLAYGRDGASHRGRLASIDHAVDRLLRERARLTDSVPQRVLRFELQNADDVSSHECMEQQMGDINRK
jgi:hypothetical protein